MKKLLRLSPPPSPLLSSKSLPLSLTSFHFPFSKPYLSSAMPPPSAAISNAGFSSLSPVTKVSTNHLLQKPFSSSSSSSSQQLSSFSSCKCSVNRSGSLGSGSGRFRAWVVYKDKKFKWFHTGSEGVFAGNGEVEKEEDNGNDEEKVEEKRLRTYRRPKGNNNNNNVGGEVLMAGNHPDLLTIPGVGPRNLRKLVDKGISGVAELKQLYRDKFIGKASDKMVEYLQSSVGIIHKNHAESITTFIKDSVDQDLKEDGSSSSVKRPRSNRLTFCVEGNISVGKTTFLQRIANETLELRDLVEVVPEPIGKWQDIGPDHFNILDAFYSEPERYAYTFQNYVFVTRVMQERESSGGIKPLRLMERSVFSDRMVFVRAVHEAKWMNEMEISIYDSWFDPVVSTLPGLVPDGFIYLRASPDTCHKRMMHRKREEEGGVSLDYLRGLHEKHESWLFPSQSGNHGVLSVSQLPSHMDNSLHPDIRDRVFYLEGDHMHSSIQKVPALILDCEPNIDFTKDIEAKEQYARQVAKFFEFVKKKKEVPSDKPGGDATRKSHQQVRLPHQGGLWVPDGKNFPDSALKSMDLRKAMSFMSG